MSDWVNFAEIRAKVPLEQVLTTLYGLTDFKRQDDRLFGKCPVHGGDNPRAFHADLGKNLWHCFTGCKKGGNAIDFVAAVDGCTVRDAALKLKRLFLDGNDAPPTVAPPAPQKAGDTPPSGGVERKPPRDKKDVDPNPPISVSLVLRYDHPHLAEERKLSDATCRHFGVGYCNRGIMAGLIAIPIHDEAGQLVAFAGRRLRPSDARELGKYKLPKGFKKERVLYNLHRALPEARLHGLILVEGFFTVLKLYEAGFLNVAAVMGSDLSDYQAEFVADLPAVTLLFDGNDAGWKGAQAAEQKLAGRVPTRLVHLPDGLEPDDLSHRALRWLLNGVEQLDLSFVGFAPRLAADGLPQPHPTLAQPRAR
jgi:DNA primase